MSRHTLLHICALTLVLGPSLSAQQAMGAEDPQVLNHILERLNALETQNRQLLEEVRSLREQLHPATAAAEKPPSDTAESANAVKPPGLDEQVSVNTSRVEEMSQTKVEAAQKFPIRLNGMLLFNSFVNSRYGQGETPADYALVTGPANSGATLSQTLLGLQFDGPRLPGNGKVSGDLMMDFWSGGPQPDDHWIRLRQARVDLDWSHRSISVGQDQPLISPHQPDSLAEVGIPALAGAGNLWYWLPQVRYEERIGLTPKNKLLAQGALLQTEEHYTGVASGSIVIEQARPGIEGRLAFSHQIDDTRRLEIGTGFHASSSRVNGDSIASRVATLDWLVEPSRYFQLSGTFFHGQNVAGLGSIADGFTIDADGYAHAVHSNGGWAQLTFPVTQRLSFHVLNGFQSNSNAYQQSEMTAHNFTYGSNVMYRLGPNLLVSFEALQLRIRELNGYRAIHNHYDLAIGYLF